MKKGRKIIFGCMICLILVVAAVPFAIACAPQAAPTPSPTPSPKAEPIRIGCFGPMTGAAAETGPEIRNACTMRLEEANWQVAGRPIELVFRDEGGGDPAFAIDAAKKMVEMDKVHIIVGPMNTAATLAVAPYLASVSMVNLALMPTGGDVEALKKAFGGWCFTVAGKGYQLTQPFGEYAYKELGYRTVTTVGQDFAAGKEFIAGFVDGFKTEGGTVIQQQWVPYGTPDMGPYLAALKDADAVIVFLIPIDMRRFLSQYIERGLFNKMPVAITRCLMLNDVALTELGDQVIGIIGEVDYVPRLDNPINNKFVAAYEAKYGKMPDGYSEHTYAATSVALAGLETTGGDTTPEKLRQAILGLKVDTPAGPVSFTPSGFGILNTYIVRVEKVDGTNDWVPIKTIPETRLIGE
jgi:branched-chain amino acid transport system substrate-binding protein